MYKSVKRLFYIVIFVTLLITCLGISIQHAPQFVKLIYSGSLWLSLLMIPKSLFRFHYFNKFTVRLFSVYALLVFGTIIHTVFLGTNAIVGNKWITMFGNDECLLMLLTPFLAYISTSDYVLSIIQRTNITYMSLCVILFVLLTNGNASALWYICCFYPFYSKCSKLLVYLTFLIAISIGFFAEETSRTLVIIAILAMLSYVLVYKIRSKILVRLACVALIALPFIYALPMLIDPNFSIIKVIQQMILDETGNSQLAADTRSFLFWELASDLNANDAWLFGKGAFSYYYSTWFDNGDLGAGMRITSEVTLLTLLLRGGIALVVSYYSILIYSVYRALKLGKNKFVLSAAVMISGWIFISSFSYVNGFKFYHLCFFVLVGCCLSNKWLNYNDEDIKRILK